MKATRTCSFPDCNRPHAGRGLCTGHRYQASKGQQLRPIRSRRTGCSVEGCDRSHSALGLCVKHSSQRPLPHMNGERFADADYRGRLPEVIASAPLREPDHEPIRLALPAPTDTHRLHNWLHGLRRDRPEQCERAGQAG